LRLFLNQGATADPSRQTRPYHKNEHKERVAESERNAGNSGVGLSVALAGLFAEVLLELAGLALEQFLVLGRFALEGDVRPDGGVVGVDPQPLAVGIVLGVRLDRVDRALRLTDAAIDAFSPS